jgi:prepilin-type N-terminal cleavage/methylation domain-containing protein
MAMRTLRIDHNQHGFTLLEVLVALAILAIGLLATASMQGVAVNSNFIANRIAVTNMLGQQILEELHSRPITDPDLLQARNNLPVLLDPVTPSNSLAIPGAGFYTATFSTTPNFPIVGTTQILATVTYTNLSGLTTSRTFTTFKLVM